MPQLPELPWDVLERVFPLLPARALLRALAVCRCASDFTLDYIGQPHAFVGCPNYQCRFDVT